MASRTEEFITSFHSLSGITIGERRKNLFLLLNKIRAFRDELDFSLLHPQTPLEETFKVDALIYFRRIPELLDVLKSENPILIKKVLKISSWFLEQAFESDELVTLIFPHVSFNVKVKIVNKLSIYLKDVEKADELFEAIRLKYGSYLALKLLPACSKEFILKIVFNSRVKLSPTPFLRIVKKYPSIMSEPFLSANFNRKHIFVYLAKNHNELFLELFTKYNPQVRLGWRITHTFICRNKEIVIKEANRFHKFLHKKQSAKTLRQDFGDFYLNLFPSSIDEFPQSFWFLYSCILQFKSNEEKLNFLEERFRKMYSCDLLEHQGSLTLSLLDLLPPHKLELISIKPPHINEDRWNCYKKVDHSIPYFKKRISLSSDVKSREELLVNLAETCRINKDHQALGDVCKYVVNQHRNDLVSVRLGFLLALKRNFELQTLPEEHWVSINELIQISDMNRENFAFVHFLVAFMHHRLLRNLDIREQLTKYITIILGNWNLFQFNPVFERQCLLLTAELMPQVYKNEALRHAHIIFLNSLVDWNNRHPDDQICLFNYPSAMDSFKAILTEKKDAGLAEQIIHYVLKFESSDPDLLRLCLSKLNLYFSNRNILNRLLHLKPLLIVNNIDVISNLVFNCYNRFFWRQSRNYTHLELPQKLGQVCLNVLGEYNRDVIKRNTITGLSYLMNANTFLEYVSDFYPTELKSDPLSEVGKEQYKLQRHIANSLKNLIPPSLALEGVLNFSKGDYLKVIQSSLYSVSGNVNEDKLPLFFDELAKRAVSVRKHTLHLTLRLLERKQIFSVFNKFMQTERNPSIRKFLLKGSFNLFIQDPDDNSWELLKSNVRTVSADDREVVQIVTQKCEIPPQYLVRYLMFIWDFLGNLADPDGDIEIERCNLLLSSSMDTIQKLPKSFCREIIEKYLFKIDVIKHQTYNIYSFTSRFIIYCASETEKQAQLNWIIPILKSYLGKDKDHTTVDRFVRQFCSEFLDKKCCSNQTLLMFSNLWNNHIKPFEAFDHYLHFQFTLISVDSVNKNLSPFQVGQNLAKLIDSLSKLYGNSVCSVVSDGMISFMRHFFHTTGVAVESSRYFLIEGMIKGNVSQACHIVATFLLKRNVQYLECQLKHDEIIQFLTKLEDPIVQIHLNHNVYRM